MHVSTHLNSAESTLEDEILIGGFVLSQSHVKVDRRVQNVLKMVLELSQEHPQNGPLGLSKPFCN